MEDMKFVIGSILGVLLLVAGLMVFGAIGNCHHTAGEVVRSGIVSYEEFESTYGACKQIDADICNLQELPDDSAMFSQFSKEQMIFTKKALLNRWIEEYNAKTRMITKRTWKSKSLPHTLSVSDFTCALK